jgi:hypothetical protein
MSSTLERVDWNAGSCAGSGQAVQQLKREPGKGLFVDVTLPLALKRSWD